MTPRRTALTAAALVTPALIAAMLVAPTAATADPVVLAMEPIGRYVAPKEPTIPTDEDQVRAESHAVLGDRLYSTNHTWLDIVDISDPEDPKPKPDGRVDLSMYGEYGITSVAASNGRVAVAIPATDETKGIDKTSPGTVVVMDTLGEVLAEVQVGALPDMLTFDDDGKRIVVANEGEPNDDYTVDPEGTVSIIDVQQLLSGKGNPVRTVRFVGVPRPSLNEYVRIFGPGASIAQDIEPEYVTIQGDRAFVSLQENNAIAEIDLRAARVVAVRGLEFKDHSLAVNGYSDGEPYGSSNALDPSDKDGGINIANWPVFGMPQPDAIASYVVGGKTYIISANEGDARDYPGFKEEARVSALTLDPTAFPTGDNLKANDQLGRLNVTTTGADTDSDGDTDRILAFGTRSMSIWQVDGTRVWDSGDTLEQVTSKGKFAANFNSDNKKANLDDRSDNKGPEPEGVAVGEIDRRTYAFVGLERVGGMAVFDVTNPQDAFFVEYVTSRDFKQSSTAGSADSGPEVMSFVSAGPKGKPLVIMSNEVSGSVTIWSPKQPTP